MAVRLSENALRVLEKRYLKKDESGKTLESPADLFHRVAKGIAAADKAYGAGAKEIQELEDSFYAAMSNLEFMPNSPTLMNAGSDLGQLSACFHPTQLIITKNGPKAVSEINIGDEVLTHQNRFRKVLEKFERSADSLYIIGVYKLPTQTLKVTSEHPILAISKYGTKPRWINAGELRIGDYVALNFPKENIDRQIVKVSDYVLDAGLIEREGYLYEKNIDIRRWTRKDGTVYTKDRNRSGDISKQVCPVKNEIVIDAPLMRLFGYYLSEGCVSEEMALRFTFSDEEGSYARDVIDIVQDKFGVSSKIEATNSLERRWISLRFHSKILASFFLSLFNTGYAAKSIPEWFIHLPIEKQKGFLAGLFRGDSCVFKNGNNFSTKLVMCNANIVYAAWQILMRLGCFAGLNFESMPRLGKVRPLKCQVSGQAGSQIAAELLDREIPHNGFDFIRSFEKEGILFSPINHIEKQDYDGKVYNLEVEEDHSYSANFVSVHNCFVLPIEDSMDSIFESLKATAMIHKCLSPGTLVMVDGGLKKLKDVKSGERILTEEGYYQVGQVHNNGIKDIFEVTTNRGYVIKGTAEHRLYVVDEDGDYVWRKISQLRPGDWVVLKPGNWRGTNKGLADFKYNYTAPNSGCFKPRPVRFPNFISVQLAELWGMYIGDGYLHRDGIRFCVGAQDKELLGYISGLSLQLFDKRPSISEYNNKNCYEISLLSIELKKWFEFLGITKESARRARIPEILKNTSEENICGFLRGLFSTDGCVRETGHITLTTASDILAEDSQIIMLYLGIPTQKTYFSSTDSYQVSICSKSGFIKFREKIGFLIKRKQERLNAIKPDEIFVREETIPHQKNRLKLWYDTMDVPEKRKVSSLIEGIIHRPSDNRQLSRQKVILMQENDLAPDFFAQLLQDDFFYCKVSEIKAIGKSIVYDLTVPYKNSYIANGFVSHNSGGGTGFSFSRLRPKNSTVFSTGGIASGPVSFMKVYDAATQAVKQGGTRRGANMGILRVDHPDILEFIQCKDSDKEITNFNISVALSEDFMQRLTKSQDYDLIDPHTKKSVKRLSTKFVFDLIVRQAHKNGEPGIIFIDRMNEFNPTPKLGSYESTNPCGEQVLLPYESCNLGSINLYRMIIKKGDRYEIDWQKLKAAVHTAVHFLDNVIDVNKFPLLDIEKTTLQTRKVGLGVMGWASMLCRLAIAYNSEEAIELAQRLMSFILTEARKKSEELAGKKGAFPAFSGSIFDKPAGPRLRNATLTTIAPTGTISIIAGPCSSGIEPLFAISYYRMVMEQDKLIETDPVFEEIAKERGFYSRELMTEIAEKGCIQDIDQIPEDVKRIFVVAHDISPEWHIRMQAAFQKWTDNATSKTINMPQEATIEDVRQAYMLAYDLGCKGVTIYRDRSRQVQVLNIERQEKKEENMNIQSETKKEMVVDKIAPRPRPEVVIGTTTKVATGCGNLYVTINSDEENMPFEVFTQMGKAGGCAASQLEAIGRLVSLAFRSGIEVKAIIEQLRNIRCPSPSWEKGVRIFSCADAIARVIEKRLTNKNLSSAKQSEIVSKPTKADEHLVDRNATIDIIGVCPDCGGALRHEEGCVKCQACGYSKC